MERETASAALQRLLGVNKVTVADLAKRGVIVPGKLGSYKLEASVKGYCAHLRDQAAGTWRRDRRGCSGPPQASPSPFGRSSSRDRT